MRPAGIASIHSTMFREPLLGFASQVRGSRTRNLVLPKHACYLLHLDLMLFEYLRLFDVRFKVPREGIEPSSAD